MNASQYYETLGGNVDRWYADEIDKAEFDRRQRATWDAIAASGLQEEVLAIWRGMNP